MANINGKDPMKEKVTVFVQMVSGEESSLFVAVNGKAWQIPRGKHVEVPKPVAEIIERSQRNNTKQLLYKQKLQESYAKSQGAQN